MTEAAVGQPAGVPGTPAPSGALGPYLGAAIALPALLAIGPLTVMIRALGRGPALWLAIAYQAATVVVWAALAPALVSWARGATETWLSDGARRTLPVDGVQWLARVLGCLAIHSLAVTVASFVFHLGSPTGETHAELLLATQSWRPALIFTFGLLFYFPFDLIAAGGITAVAIVAAQRRAGMEVTVRTARLEQQLEQARLRALGAQLEPHFLFNALGAATALARRNAGADAARVLVSLSDLLRRLLDRSAEATVSVTEELEFIRQYLDIEQVRFGDRLVATVDATPDAAGCRIPSLLVQPLVENAIKHGIATREDSGGEIVVRAAVQGGRLHIEVTDNGPGLASEGDTGVGLRATRERLAAQYGARATLELLLRPEGGALARLTLPADGELRNG